MDIDLHFTGFEARRAKVVEFEDIGTAPCETCPFADLCAEEGTECTAFRNFCAGKKVTEEMVGKFRR